MERDRGKAAQRIRNLFGSDASRFSRGLAAQQIRQERRTRQSCDASARPETRFRDAPLFHTNGKLEDIAADRILDGDRGRRAVQRPRIARILKVVEHGFAVHSRSIARES